MSASNAIKLIEQMAGILAAANAAGPAIIGAITIGQTLYNMFAPKEEQVDDAALIAAMRAAFADNLKTDKEYVEAALAKLEGQRRGG